MKLTTLASLLYIASVEAMPYFGRREAAPADRAPPRVRFMPLGDSITELSCWRAYVQDHIIEANLTMAQVDFVGSLTNNEGKCKTKASRFDTSHEGHSGFEAIDIANNWLENWLEISKPEVVQFMLGTNDVLAKKPMDDIMNAYTRMVELMRASNPRMKIIVDKLISSALDQNSVDELNIRIPRWAKRYSTRQSPIVVADCSRDAGFTMDMLKDGVHTNDKGDHFMAAQIAPLAIRAIEEVLEERRIFGGQSGWDLL